MAKTASVPRRQRDLEKTRKEILDVAFHEVYRRGFQGVSIDDIVKKTSLTKGAFYHHFPTKMDLGYALVEDVITPMIIDRWITPLDQFENPVQGILKQMKELIGNSSPSTLRLGCPLNNLVQEMAPIDEGFKIRLQAALRLWISETQRQLQRAKKSGHLKADANVRQTAHFVVMAHEGIYGLLKGLGDPAAFDPLFESVKSHFRAIQA